MEIELSEFLFAQISNENLLSMPRMRLAFQIIDAEQTKVVEIEKIISILVTSLSKSS